MAEVSADDALRVARDGRHAGALRRVAHRRRRGRRRALGRQSRSARSRPRGPWFAGGYHNVPRTRPSSPTTGGCAPATSESIDPHGYLQHHRPRQGPDQVGRRVDPSVDLENALMAHPGVAEAAVIAVRTRSGASGRSPRRGEARPVGDAGRAERALLAKSFAKWQLPDALSSSMRSRGRRRASS